MGLVSFLGLEFWLSSPVFILFGAFVLWMLVDAIRREEWLWVVFILVFPMLNAPLYFFLVYRRGSTLMTQGFEFPGAQDRRRIKHLEAQIQHLDKAHHHLELGDIYFHQGKLDKALSCYEKAVERDSEDLDIRGHLGQCLLRLNRPEEAKKFLERVCIENPKHDYGHSLMALAEAHAALGEVDAAIQTLKRVLDEHSYARARVQLAGLYLAKEMKDAAHAELKEVLADDRHAPEFQRKRDRPWIRRAKRMLA
jgi:tetratricopeptide (TPR) repeat protein